MALPCLAPRAYLADFSDFIGADAVGVADWGLTLKQYWERERAIGSGWLVPKEPIQWVY